MNQFLIEMKNNLLEVFKFKDKILFKGTIRGRIITNSDITYYCRSFIINIDERIEGIPEEFPVFAETTSNFKYLVMTHLREGDTVQLNGKIIQSLSNFWQKDIIWMRANHIYNETLQFGY